jgi:hypothetical protein
MIDSAKLMALSGCKGKEASFYIAIFWALAFGTTQAQDASSLIGQGGSVRAAEALPPPVSLMPNSSASTMDRFGTIAVRQLDSLSSDSIGLLDEFTGGLPIDLWSGTSKELVDLLLPKLPRRLKSVAARDLTKRLLLSVARPPEATLAEDVFVDMTAIVPSAIGFTSNADRQPDLLKVDGEQTGSVELALLERRLTQLAAMGDWSSVGALIIQVAPAFLTDDIRILASDLALVEGRVEQVCLDVTENLRVSTKPYWQKVFAFCQLRDGNAASAFLTLDLLRETGIDDAVFFWVAELMAGNRPITPNGLKSLSPLQLSMLRHAGRPFPPQLVRDGDPTLLRVLATSEPLYVVSADEAEDVIADRLRQALDLRLESAERAVQLGALDVDVLRALYRVEAEIEVADERDEGVSLIAVSAAQDQDELEPLLDLSSIPVATAIDRARLFVLAERQSIPTAKAMVVSRAIDFARNDSGRNGPDVGAMGQVFAPLILELLPTGDLVWFAGNAARALISAGEVNVGAEWLELSKAYARTSIEASDVAAATWPIERQLRPSMMNRFTPLRFKRWEESRPPGLVANNKTLVLSTLTALGEPVAAADWMGLMDRRVRSSVDMPAPQIWNVLTLAAQDGRMGEVIMLSLIMLDEAGPSGSSPVILSHVISSLMTVGLEDEARLFAVEAALIQGL